MTLSDSGNRAQAGAAALGALRGAIEAGRPWPLAEHFGVEPEASWGPMETLAHVAEMLPYWLGQIETILEADGPVAFGRVAADDLRIGRIEHDRRLPARELLSRIATDADRVARRLAELSPEEATRTGTHPTRGEVSVAEIAERFIAGHLEEHVRQIEEILAAAPAR